MTRDEYIARAVAAGEDPESAAHTWELGEKIERVLKDEDLDPWAAPEMRYPQKIRLLRLFIEEYKAEVRRGDQVIARWLRSYADRTRYPDTAGVADGIALKIERGEHWKWWHTVGVKTS